MSAFKSDTMARVMSELSEQADDGAGFVKVTDIRKMLRKRLDLLVAEVVLHADGYGFCVEDDKGDFQRHAEAAAKKVADRAGDRW